MLRPMQALIHHQRFIVEEHDVEVASALAVMEERGCLEELPRCLGRDI